MHVLRIERRDAALARERQVARNEALPSSSELLERAEDQRWLVEALLALPGSFVDIAADHIELRDDDGRRWAGRVAVRGLFASKPVQEGPLSPLFGSLPPGRYTARVERPDGSLLAGAVELTADSPQIETLRLE